MPLQDRNGRERQFMVALSDDVDFDVRGWTELDPGRIAPGTSAQLDVVSISTTTQFLWLEILWIEYNRGRFGISWVDSC